MGTTAGRVLRGTTLGLGGAGVVVGAVGLSARTVGIGWQPVIVLATFAPFTALAALVGTGLLVARRAWVGAAVGTVVVVVAVAGLVPLAVGTTPTPGRPFVVLQANLMIGAADPAALVARVRDDRVEVLTVDELTPAALAGLTAAGLDGLLPHRLVTPFPGGAGTGIWSVHPLHDTVEHDEFRFELLGATVDVPGAVPVRLFAVHLLPPWPYPSATWRAEFDRLEALLADASRAHDVVVASGDFNATLDHRRFRALLRGGLHDAAERAGAGYAPTYPTDRGVPPLVTLDHVVSRGADAAAARTLELPGSDHRGLLVTLLVPPA